MGSGIRVCVSLLLVTGSWGTEKGGWFAMEAFPLYQDPLRVGFRTGGKQLGRMWLTSSISIVGLCEYIQGQQVKLTPNGKNM